MKTFLEPLRTSSLTNLECGQLVRRHLSDLATIQSSLLTDAPFNTYITGLTGYADNYEKALLQIRKSEETEKILLADDARDKAVSALNKALKLYAGSDDPVELEASRVLGILFDSYKNVTTLNYEAETIAIDKLVSELTGSVYSPMVAKLQMGRYVTRLSTANEAFKTLFGSRMLTTAMTETYDLKSIRKEMMTRYSEFCDYVLAMAKALNTPLFTSALDLLNTARKYYADQLARRLAPKEEKETPVA